MTKHVAIAAVLCALAGTASAQDFEEETTEETTTEAPATDTSTTSSDAPPAAAAGGAPKWGIEVGLNAIGDEPNLHGLMNLGGSNYLDLAVGFDLLTVMPEGGDTELLWNLRLLAGYRMYKPLTGRIRPFLEPFGTFQYIDFVGDDDPEDNPIVIGAGALLGADFELFEQFTLGTAVGAAATFTITDGGNLLELGLLTAAIRATFWW
jgi:hypothetical protein